MIASAHGHLFTSLFFFGFIALSLGLTWWSMRRARDATGFFVAGRRLTGWQNGLAISGDYMSAASFLGIAGLVSLFGYDGLLYSFGFIVGWVVIVLLVAEPLRNSGKYTLSDVMAFRLRARPVRAAAAVSSVTIGLFYLLAQLVGAGAIASLLLPIPLLALQLGGGPETLGGEILVAFISAVTFATILAVVAGLIIAAATNIAHDVYTRGLRSNRGGGKRGRPRAGRACRHRSERSDADGCAAANLIDQSRHYQHSDRLLRGLVGNCLNGPRTVQRRAFHHAAGSRADRLRL
jgi:Na+(H+)/acetate symporter ActP